MKKLFLLLVAVLTVGLAAMAQNRTVTGTVLDASTGEPIIGASVLPYGGDRGVSTDFDGHFTITVPPSVTKLTFSYVGMHTKDLAIPANNKMTVELDANSNVLDDVIVVAYGTTKKAAYTGSASVVKADQLEDALVANVTNALNGKMSGVQTLSSNGQPGTGATVRIRGVGSINASANPLYVVDGMPYDGDIAAISTNDIESLTVLKDAASTALYGARGANGVILVTTKKGKQSNAKITVDMRWGSNSRAVPQYNVISDERQYLETMYQSMYMTNIMPTSKTDGMSPADAHAAVNAEFWKTLGYQTWTVPAGQDLFGTNGKLNPNATPGYTDGRYYYLADDWTKNTLINGLRQEYNLSLQGGNDRLNYYVSGSYLEDEGIIANSHFNRLSTRAAIDFKATKWLTIGTNVAYSYTNSAYPDDMTNDSSTSSGNAFYFINGLGPVFPMFVRNADGSIMINKNYGHKVYDYGGGDWDYGNGLLSYSRTPYGNPAASLLYDVTDWLSDIMDGKWYATITPIQDLNITGTLGYHLDNTRLHQILNPVYGQFAEMGGQALQMAQRTRSIQTQLLGTYSKTIAEKNNFDILVGYEYQNYQEEWVEGVGDNLYNPSSFVVNNTIDNRLGYGAQANLVHIGYLGRLNYNYDNKYFFMASIRRDGSSRFAPEHRWGTFWSASAGWNITNENFMHDITWLDLLKFKVSFGQNGNDNIGNSTTYINYADQYRMSGADGVFTDATLWYKGNYDITWETSNSFNTGFDFAMLNGRLQGTIEYYSRQTSNMLFNLPTSPSLGYSSIPSNVGSMRNYGAELELNYTIINNKNVTWDVNANVTMGSNKIIKLDPSILNEDGQWISGSRIMEEGEPLYQMYIPHYAGVDPETGYALYTAIVGKTDEAGNPVYTDKQIGVDAAGNPIYEQATEEQNTPNYQLAYNSNRIKTGNLMPKAYGGFGTSVKVYGFDFSISCAYQLGGKVYDSGYQSYMQAGNNIGATWHKDILNAWTPSNTNTNVPRLYTTAEYQYANSTSDRFLISSNYLSLNNITIGYTLPKSWTRKLQLTNVRIYGAAENVALWSRRKGLDPRQSYTSSLNSTYSPIRTISGGLKVEF